MTLAGRWRVLLTAIIVELLLTTGLVVAQDGPLHPVLTGSAFTHTVANGDTLPASRHGSAYQSLRWPR
jgi:hypothetical protein